ncbi:cerebellar degeneration-related protein 2-like [Engraulis encrasicolus]|uniref:cerebellar degeneration-related protein 2-like n=1 Tax=Engraulis encrasicolus TaxID=184585 RepID=UPI002FD620D2
MLTDMIVEEEFEIKEEEPWYDQQDLEHDLHLAAELGKTLLDRNRELEDGLKQMYGTNQEQLQEIEYLSKQVELLRSVNDQHAKVYEQLDNMARDLEQNNHRLVMDNRAAQHKIQGLTDTVEGLQAQVDDLQKQMGDLSVSTAHMSERRRSSSSKSHTSGNSGSRHSSHSASDDVEDDDYSDDDDDHLCGTKEEVAEYESLSKSLQTLQAQLAAERARREGTEREADALARECGELELRLSAMEGCQARLAEAEAEVAELRELWRNDGHRRHHHHRDSLSTTDDVAAANNRLLLLPDMCLLPDPLRGRSGGGGGGYGYGYGHGRGGRLKRCSSERQLRVTQDADVDGDAESGLDDDMGGGVRKSLEVEDLFEINGGVGVGGGSVLGGTGSCCRFERGCLGRSEVVKQRGISLLNEVDAQYSALQVKYDALLRRCEGGAQAQSHKAVQTPAGASASSSTSTTKVSTSTTTTSSTTETDECPPLHSIAEGMEEDAQLPEYKVLFHEIFKCIQRSKADILQNRTKPRHVE